MSEAKTQAGRTLAVHTPLGDDKLVLSSVHGSESLGRLFQFELELFSEGTPAKTVDLLGQSVTIRLALFSGGERYFNGRISRFAFAGVEETDKGRKIYVYHATMVPWTWFLTRKANCRIFQDKKVPDIIKQIISEHGHAGDVKLQLTGSYRTWEYCVQYRESDFNFISRLMEHEGIYYYFEQAKEGHTIVLCDNPSAHSAAPNFSELHFDRPDPAAEHDDFIWDWSLGQEVTSNKVALTDYNFTTPSTSLFKSVDIGHDYKADTLEVFDFPGIYTVAGEGKGYVTIRSEEIKAGHVTGHGTSSARGIFAGCTFKLVDHPACDEQEYLITSISYQMRNLMGQGHGGGGAGGEEFVCQVTAIPSSYEYRAPRVTPKPLIQGPQTAVVVGQSGEEIYVDKYGRIKVQFFWDREGKKDENSSCWIRVAQQWAGKQWGIIFTPRIGQEVMVDFLEGDPDRPIITGRVYNAEQMPPYSLPANKTQSTIKTRSSLKGTAENFNEIRFEDKKDSEQLFIHAEKNQDIEVEKDETHWVGHDRTKTIDNDETTNVKHDRTETVDNNEIITIHGTRTETVDKDETVTIHETRTETVDKDVTITWGGKLTQTIAKEVQITMNDALKESVAKDKSESIDGARSISVGKDDSLSVSKKLAIDAGDEISIKTGDASITMQKDGTIVIKGKDITIQGSGKINIKADSDMVLKGSKIAAN